MTQTALITGASSGIGMELAKLLAKDKYNLLLVARSKQKLTQLGKELQAAHGIDVKLLPYDLAKPGNPEMIMQKLEQNNIKVDILINNAGFGDYGKFIKTNWDKEQDMINLNISALTYLSKACAKKMVKQGKGKIMNVASTASFFPGPLMAVYFATKAYVLSFSQALGEELKGTGVTVTTLCPGPTASGFQDAANLNEAKSVKGKKLPTSAEVAYYGYYAMLSGKPVAIHGTNNKFLVFMSRLLPRKTQAKMVKKAQEKQ